MKKKSGIKFKTYVYPMKKTLKEIKNEILYKKMFCGGGGGNLC